MRFIGLSSILPAVLGGVLLASLTGCGDPVAQFRLNRLYVAKQIGNQLTTAGADDVREAQKVKVGRERQLRTIEESLTAMFGTPDEPFIIDDAEIGVDQVINPSLLTMAAGKVGKDENGFARGLYRQHCAHCHGVTGDGKGPTAEFLNPFPRDFRPGIYKFKSTPLGEKPTDADLHKTLWEGIPGTAMPSFKLLAEDELAALVNYVKYLSVRGEVERKMIDELVLTYGPEDEFETNRDTLVNFLLAEVIAKWARAPESVTDVPPPTREDSGKPLRDSVNLGRELFNGKANCYTCHGITALGDGRTDDYDEWMKDFADWKNLKPEEREKKLAEYKALGGLGPRNAQPRNLRQGVFRGGRRPVDLYWRIRNGIEGTPMPESKTLSDEELWGLIDYVQQLAYEDISQPPGHVVENLREKP